MECAEPAVAEAPPSPGREDWVGLSTTPLPVDRAASWVVRPQCGAVVTFSGTARDHSEGRTGVSVLEYEAYEPYASRSLTDVAGEARQRWPGIGRLVIWHRTGPVAVTESAVVVAVSSAHRDVAFESARYIIDTVKSTAPLWKKEHWPGGGTWVAAGPLATVREPARSTAS